MMLFLQKKRLLEEYYSTKYITNENIQRLNVVGRLL